MITKSTVLVLGAGSAPGFPSGWKLREVIIAGSTDSALGNLGTQLLQHGYTGDKILAFVNALRTSGQLSVDRFLERRPDLVPVGKAAIALALSRFELLDNLHVRTGPPSWYDLFFNATNAASLEDWGENAFGVVTFNYDRSFEQYLLTSLSSTYGRPTFEVAEQLRKKRIIHVHGMLGGLPPLQATGRAYAPEPPPSDLKIAAAGIRIIAEAAENDPAFAEAQELLAGASRVVFLGFGYDELNLKRLNAGALADGREFIGGTGYGLTPAEHQRVLTVFNGHYLLGPQDHGSDMFLRS